MKKCFIWITLRPMYTKYKYSKRAKIDNRLYFMLGIKAYQLLKFDEEGYKRNISLMIYTLLRLNLFIQQTRQ